jgi:arylsulfatase A-like enzyme
VKPGTHSDFPVSSVDIFPTITEAVGVQLPAGKTIDGTSLTPILKQTGIPQRDALFWHFPHYRGSVVPYSIIRKKHWKLIKRYEGKTYELFNLKDDLSETIDLAPQMPDKVRELDRELIQWLRHTQAKLPRRNPDYTPPRKK